MKRLYIDFDGVIMDTIPLLYNELAKNNVSIGDEKEVRRVFAAFDLDNATRYMITKPQTRAMKTLLVIFMGSGIL